MGGSSLSLGGQRQRQRQRCRCQRLSGLGRSVSVFAVARPIRKLFRLAQKLRGRQAVVAGASAIAHGCAEGVGGVVKG